MKRWAFVCESTRPRSLVKAQQDAHDIRFLLRWLAERNMFIEFDQYQTKQQGNLDGAVRRYIDITKQDGLAEELRLVHSVLKDEDRKRIEGVELR